MKIFVTHQAPVIVIALLTQLTSMSVIADNLDTTKIVTWQYIGVPAKPNAQDNGGTRGEYSWDLSALAKDNHLSHLKNEKNNADWAVTNGLPITNKTTGLQGGGNDPEAKVEAKFTATAPVLLGIGPNTYLTSGSIQLIASSKIKKKVDAANVVHINRKARSQAKKASMTIASGVLLGGSIRQPGAKKLKIVNTTRMTKGIVEYTRKSSKEYKDPVSIMLRNATTDTIVATQELFSFDVTADQHGDLIWDETMGIILDVLKDDLSSVSITGGFIESDWTSGTEFSASLFNGIWSQSGLLDIGDWSFTCENSTLCTDSSTDIVGAFLPKEFMPTFEQSYAIPSSLSLNSGDMYEEILLIDSSALIENTAVPLPASVWLFGSGLAGIAGIARRKNKKQS